MLPSAGFDIVIFTLNWQLQANHGVRTTRISAPANHGSKADDLD
jgi:hypothetical protein